MCRISFNSRNTELIIFTQFLAQWINRLINQYFKGRKI